MAAFLLNILGKNRTGMVADVSRCLQAHGVNISDSSMTSLRSAFTMMMVLETPPDLDQQRFEIDLQNLENRGLNLHLSPMSTEEATASTPLPNYSLSVLGADKTGIVYPFTELLSQYQINLTDVNTRLLGTSESPIYAMIMEMELPSDCDPGDFKQALTQLAQELTVDATLHPIETATL